MTQDDAAWLRKLFSANPCHRSRITGHAGLRLRCRPLRAHPIRSAFSHDVATVPSQGRKALVVATPNSSPERATPWWWSSCLPHLLSDNSMSLTLALSVRVPLQRAQSPLR
jgi:hypothetical protein